MTHRERIAKLLSETFDKSGTYWLAMADAVLATTERDSEATEARAAAHEQALEDLAAAGAMLRKMEWVTDGFGASFCPECGRSAEYHHDADCALLALLRNFPA